MENDKISCGDIQEKMRILLGIAEEDEDINPLLEVLIDSVKARLMVLLGGLEVPAELSHIVLEVAVSRFNRIGNEGMSSYSQEGESMSFEVNDFSGFMDEIRAYLDKVNGRSGKGGFKFL